MSEEEADRIRDAVADIIGMVPFVLVFDQTPRTRTPATLQTQKRNHTRDTGGP